MNQLNFVKDSNKNFLCLCLSLSVSLTRSFFSSSYSIESDETTVDGDEFHLRSVEENEYLTLTAC